MLIFLLPWDQIVGGFWLHRSLRLYFRSWWIYFTFRCLCFYSMPPVANFWWRFIMTKNVPITKMGSFCKENQIVFGECWCWRRKVQTLSRKTILAEKKQVKIKGIVKNEIFLKDNGRTTVKSLKNVEKTFKILFSAHQIFKIHSIETWYVI